MHKFIGVLFVLLASPAIAERSEFTDLSLSPHALLVTQSDKYVSDREVGLDALQKRLGHWGFEESTRVSARLLEATYQIIDGYSAAEFLQQHIQKFKDERGLTTLFQCEGRDCGRAVQWANRVFEQRLLYGQDNDQHYWVGKSDSGDPSLYVAYSAYRTESRQYLVLQRYLLDTPSE
jgi:hypothetical protein